MKTLVLTMLLTFILSGCRNGVNYGLNHTEKSYSPVFVYLPNGDIDSRESFCIISAQKLSISGHEFLPVKSKEPIGACDRAIGFKGSKLYEFYNKAAFEIRKGAGFQARKKNDDLGFQSGKSYEASGAIDGSEDEKRHFHSSPNRSGY